MRQLADFFRFRARDVDPFRARRVARLDPVDDIRRDGHALRQRDRRVADRGCRVRFRRFIQRDLQVHTQPDGFIRGLGIGFHTDTGTGVERQQVATRDRGEYFRLVGIHTGFLPRVGGLREALRARRAIRRQRIERDRGKIRRFTTKSGILHNLAADVTQYCRVPQIFPRIASWLGSAGTPQNVSSMRLRPIAGTPLSATSKPYPSLTCLRRFRACGSGAPSTTALSHQPPLSQARTPRTGPLPE